MIATNINRKTLEDAAEWVGVHLEIKPLPGRENRWRVKLYPELLRKHFTVSGRRLKGEPGNAKYQRIGVGLGSAGRRINAVCWHGFRDFFRACYAREPEAVFITAITKYRGAEDFESRYRDTGSRNVGSQFEPASFASACSCPERGSCE